MAEPEWRWQRLSCGALRFWGVEAMREIRELISGDNNYTWLLAPWPGVWLDVYPRTIEAQNALLEIVGTPEAR